MLMPDGPMSIEDKFGGVNMGREHSVGDEAESLRYSRRESVSDELVSSAETPQELFIGLRMLEKQKEDGSIPPNLEERYTPPRQLAIMYERAENLSLSVEELLQRGWVTEYNPVTGDGKLTDSRLEGMAVKIHVTDRFDSTGRYIGVEKKYNFGTPESRKTLENAYRKAITELEARDILGEHLGVRMSIDVRDSLEDLVRVMHSGRMPKFKPEHLQALFNLPDVDELATNPENHLLGDQIEEAIFLNLVMLNSGSKEKMNDFLERPGSIKLMDKIANKWGVTVEQWKRENVGDVDKWKNGESRLLTDEGENRASWREESESGVRGTLTKWSNIAAWGGNPAEFSSDKEKEFIETIIGGIVGSKEASWLAASIMRATGTYASEGYVATNNTNAKNTLLPLGEGRFISGDDTGKFHAYMFNLKEGLKGQSSGLKDLIGRIPDLSMNLFDWAAVEIEEPNKDGNLEFVNRSIWDAWLGTKGGNPIINLLNGKPVSSGETTAEEPYHPLGSLKFGTLEREFHNSYAIMQWLMGSGEGPTGVLTDALKTDCRFEDFDLAALKKKIKYIKIVMNPIVLTKGSPHLYDLGIISGEQLKTYDIDLKTGKVSLNVHEIESKAVETVQRRFFRNVMAAKMRSYSFAVNVLPGTLKVLNPHQGPVFIDVPQAHLAKMFVEEASKKAPSDVEKLIDHYIDDIARLSIPENKLQEVGKVRGEIASWLTNEVGLVVGKNII